MHVLILPSWYFPPGADVIAGRMFHHLAAGLREEGVDARVFYGEYSIKGPLFKKATFKAEEGVPTWRSRQWFPPKANTLLFRWWIDRQVRGILQYIQKEGRPDLFHAQSYPAACVCTELQKQIKIPFIYTERLSGFILDTIPGHHMSFIRKSLAAADEITCVGPGLKETLRYYTNKNIRVVPNFYDERIFYPAGKDKKNDLFTWVSVGEPAYIKGLDVLFQAFALLKNVLGERGMQLILVDRIPERKKLEQLARSLGIADNLVWTGLVSSSYIGNILRSSHALVSASRVETFGKAILEAQACGLPVVATATGGAKYILTSPLQGELAEVDNAEDLLQAMARVMRQYRRYDENAIRDAVRGRFEKRTVIRQWLEVYQSVKA